LETKRVECNWSDMQQDNVVSEWNGDKNLIHLAYKHDLRGPEIVHWWPGKAAKGECNDLTDKTRGCWYRARLLTDPACSLAKHCLHVAAHDGEPLYSFTCPTWVRNGMGLPCKLPQGWQACPERFTLLREGDGMPQEFREAVSTECRKKAADPGEKPGKNSTSPTCKECVDSGKAWRPKTEECTDNCEDVKDDDTACYMDKETCPKPSELSTETKTPQQPVTDKDKKQSAESESKKEGQDSAGPSCEVCVDSGKAWRPKTKECTDNCDDVMDDEDACYTEKDKCPKPAAPVEEQTKPSEQTGCMAKVEGLQDLSMYFDLRNNQWYRCTKQLMCEKFDIAEISKKSGGACGDKRCKDVETCVGHPETPTQHKWLCVPDQKFFVIGASEEKIERDSAYLPLGFLLPPVVVAWRWRPGRFFL